MNNIRNLPVVSTQFYEVLKTKVDTLDVYPETARDRWMWNAAQQALLKQIEGATRLKSDPMNDPKAFRTSVSSSSVSESSTKSSTEPSTLPTQTRDISEHVYGDTLKPTLIARLWQKVTGSS